MARHDRARRDVLVATLPALFNRTDPALPCTRRFLMATEQWVKPRGNEEALRQWGQQYGPGSAGRGGKRAVTK